LSKFYLKFKPVHDKIIGRIFAFQIKFRGNDLQKACGYGFSLRKLNYSQAIDPRPEHFMRDCRRGFKPLLRLPVDAVLPESEAFFHPGYCVIKGLS
jgi:hypothetical protein